ncbi:hypothetical protein BXZ70DRAFT_1009307 [Cristinia sonorae]|uniref:Uncharacterized protein n=1 Tax=Cristinia sonorae TaxID=1940300 RepID=A0A8K0UKW1_9AGAR|nr:hypothetical protein BXZ70DRAFT_1009307 [Cristinia sonorae]
MNLKSPLKSLRAWVKSVMSTSLDLPNNHGSFSSALPAPSHMPVQEYADKLLKFVERQNDPATAQVLFPVRALHHMKNRSVSEHEYLAVEFSVKDATVMMERKGEKEPGDKEKGGRAGSRVPKTWYMVFERTLSSPNNPKAALRSLSGNEQYPQDIQDILNVIKEKAEKTDELVDDGTTPPSLSTTPSTSSFASMSVSSLASSSPSSSSPSSSSSSPSRAIDQVYYLKELPTENVEMVASVTLPPHADLTLLRLAFIAAHLHKFEPVYSLLLHQCYWYAALLLAIILRMFRISDKVAQDFKLTHDRILPPGYIFRHPDFKAGTWRSIPIIFIKKKMIETAHALVNKLWEDEVKPKLLALEQHARQHDVLRSDNEVLRSDNEVLRSGFADAKAELADKDEQLADKDEQLADKDEQLADKDEQLADKDEQLADKDKQLADKDEQLANQNEELTRLRRALEELGRR